MQGPNSDADQVCSSFVPEEELERITTFPKEIARQIANIIEDMQQRWRDMHRRYFDGLIDQVKQMSKGRTSTRTVQEYIEMRRGTIGVYPAIAVTEYLDLSSRSMAAAADLRHIDMVSTPICPNMSSSTRPFRNACVFPPIWLSCM